MVICVQRWASGVLVTLNYPPLRPFQVHIFTYLTFLHQLQHSPKRCSILTESFWSVTWIERINKQSRYHPLALYNIPTCTLDWRAFRCSNIHKQQDSFAGIINFFVIVALQIPGKHHMLRWIAELTNPEHILFGCNGACEVIGEFLLQTSLKWYDLVFQCLAIKHDVAWFKSQPNCYSLMRCHKMYQLYSMFFSDVAIKHSTHFWIIDQFW